MSRNKQFPKFDAANAALNDLEAKFKHWRQNKSYARESVPLDLLKSAQALSQHIGVTAVRSRLGISSDQLNRAQEVSETQPDFVQLDTTQTTPENPVRIEIYLPNGARITVDGIKHYSKQLLSQILEGIYDCAES